MKLLNSLTEEQSQSKVAAVFDTEDQARHVADDVRRVLQLDAKQVRVVTPRDRHPGRKLEPESHGIFLTILVAHYKLGIAGLVFGLLLFGVLYAKEIPFIVNSPAVSLAVIVAFSINFGLMAGGLVSLRPDHAPYLREAMDALQAGQAVVVVHPLDEAQREQAVAQFQALGKSPVSTL